MFAAAHGQPASKAFDFHFESVKTRAPVLIALLDNIDAHPAAFRDWVIQRVAAFSPPNGHTAITGYLVAGGGSGGFSFAEPGFYLNLNYFSDFDTARVVMAHELYHAVQNIYAAPLTGPNKPWFSKDDAAKGPNATLAQQCSTTADLFDALYQEGSASYVGDIQLLAGIDTPDAKKNFDEFQEGLGQIGHDTTLLELSVTGLDAPQPVPFEDVYALGFYVPAPLYNLGYVMAKAIDKDSGRAAFIATLSQPAWRFTDAYLHLPGYGKDHDHPKLGPNTVATIHRLTAGCPRPSTHV